MIANPEVITEQIAKAIVITKCQIEANINKLKALGIVERIGARKNGRQEEMKEMMQNDGTNV
jgi:predicted transcriptional regulator